MKLSGFLNKPRWQAKEASVRRAGVAGDDDPELIATLANIARQDSDPGVRNAAMRRLADPALTQRLAQDDADPGVRADARKLWFELMAGTHPRAPTAIECARLLRAQDDTALIEHVARAATDASLRGAALERVTRTALLAERVTGDPAPELRLAALERIDDEALLERLAERTRKTDKRLSRRARDRADALRIARGDSDVAETLARTLCERMEKLVREPRHDGAETDIDVQWSAIEARAGDALRARYQAARRLVTASRNAPAPAVAAAPVEPAVASIPCRAEEPQTTAASELEEPVRADEHDAQQSRDPLVAETPQRGIVQTPRSQASSRTTSSDRRACFASNRRSPSSKAPSKPASSRARTPRTPSSARCASPPARRRGRCSIGSPTQNDATPSSASGSTGATISAGARSANRSKH